MIRSKNEKNVQEKAMFNWYLIDLEIKTKHAQKNMSWRDTSKMGTVAGFLAVFNVWSSKRHLQPNGMFYRQILLLAIKIWTCILLKTKYH